MLLELAVIGLTLICGGEMLLTADRIRRDGAQRGRHSARPGRPTPPAPPTSPQSPAPPDTDGGERRRLAVDWREPAVPFGADPPLIRPYVLPRMLATGAGR